MRGFEADTPVYLISGFLASHIYTMIPEKYTNNGNLTDQQVRLLASANEHVQVEDIITALSFLLNGGCEDNHLYIQVADEKLFPYVKRVLIALLGDYSMTSKFLYTYDMGAPSTLDFTQAVTMKFAGGFLITLDDGTLYKNYNYKGFRVDRTE